MRCTICETKGENPSTYDTIFRKQAEKLKTVTNCFKNVILIFLGHNLASLHFCRISVCESEQH